MGEGGVAGSVAHQPRIAPEHRAGALRSCLAQFATGVTVVTFDGDSGPRGLTVNAFASVSLAPPLVLVSVAKKANAHEQLVEKPFCVNVLSAEQETLARLFAGVLSRDLPRWAEPCEHGVPRLEGALAFLECMPWRRYEGGDHSLFLGEVVHFGHRRGSALVYLSHRFTTISEPEFGVEYLI